MGLKKGKILVQFGKFEIFGIFGQNPAYRKNAISQLLVAKMR